MANSLRFSSVVVRHNMKTTVVLRDGTRFDYDAEHSFEWTGGLIFVYKDDKNISEAKELIGVFSEWAAVTYQDD